MSSRFSRVPIGAARKRLPGSVASVLIALCSFADPAGRCWPSLARISDATNIPRKKIPALTRKLEKEGLIIRIRGKHGRSTEYIVQYSETASEAATSPTKGDQAGKLTLPDRDNVSPSKDMETIESVPSIGALTAQDLQQPTEQPTLRQSTHGSNLGVRQAFDAWNSFAKDCQLPVAKSLGKKLEINLEACLLACGGIDGWNSILERIRATPFLLGQSDSGWRPKLDWVCKASNFAKIVNGRYEQGGRRTSSYSEEHAEISQSAISAPPLKKLSDRLHNPTGAIKVSTSTELAGAQGGPPDHPLGVLASALCKLLGQVKVESWFRDLTIESSSTDLLVIGAPTPFVRDWVQREYADAIIRCWNQTHPTARLPLGAVKFVVRR